MVYLQGYGVHHLARSPQSVPQKFPNPLCLSLRVSSESASGSQAGVLQGHVTFSNTLPLSGDSLASYSSPQECQGYRHTPCTHLFVWVPQILGQQASMVSAFTG